MAGQPQAGIARFPDLTVATPPAAMEAARKEGAETVSSAKAVAQKPADVLGTYVYLPVAGGVA